MAVYRLSRWLSGEESTCQTGDVGLIAGLGRSPREGNGNSLQYSCLENPMDREPGRLQRWWWWCWFSCSVVSDSATPWTVARQAPLSMGFSRQEYWSGLSFPSPGNLPNWGIEPGSPASQADSSLTKLQGKPRLQWMGSQRVRHNWARAGVCVLRYTAGWHRCPYVYTWAQAVVRMWACLRASGRTCMHVCTHRRACLCVAHACLP